MSGRAGATSVDPDAAREHVIEILDGSRYGDDSVPRPLRAPLEWLGDRLRPIGDAVSSVYESVPAALWLLVIAVVVGLLVWRLLATGGRRAVHASVETDRASSALRADPAVLEEQAEFAEARGDHAQAVRLRYRAGVLRLERIERVEAGAASTSGQLRARLSSPRFDGIADTFDDVAYGERPAGPRESDRARQDWPEVVSEARR